MCERSGVQSQGTQILTRRCKASHHLNIYARLQVIVLDATTQFSEYNMVPFDVKSRKN